MDADDVLRWLRRRGSRRNREGMARYGITSPQVFGVSMATMRPLLRKLGRNHELALQLWATGWLEARILAGFIDEPGRVTPHQMEQWVADFDNWAVCDSTCLHLFARTPSAWALRQIGKRNRALNTAAASLARTLVSTSDSRSARWVGADALRELSSPVVQARLRSREEKKRRSQIPRTAKLRTRSTAQTSRECNRADTNE